MPSGLERTAARRASSDALLNSRRLLRAARLLYTEADFQPLATSLLALAHEELGKALLLRIVAEDGAELDSRAEKSDGTHSRRVIDDHGTKFALSVGLIIHDELELALIEAFERLLSRPLTVPERQVIGSGLVGGQMLSDMARDGALSKMLASLSPQRRQALSDIVEQSINWVRLEYDGLSSSKSRGLYVDIDLESMEILTPENSDPQQFTFLAARLEKALRRLEATPVKPGRFAPRVP